MTAKRHNYRVRVTWTGNTGSGTGSYRAYARAHEITVPGNADGPAKPPIPGSSDPAFRGDPARWNPEELLVASLSACHKLWYLHLCSQAGIIVTAYEDDAEGVMVEADDGAGRFESVTLRPRVRITAASDPALALALHGRAHELCFIARSVNFPVRHEAGVGTE